IGQRHGLGAIDVLTDNGKMNEEAGPYAGQDRYECRRNMVADLEKEGLLVQIEDYSHSLGHCQRCDTVIEPRISTQWFVKIKPLAERAIEAVRDGRIRIVPERFTQVYYNWMENIRDWCISRQLWWGHRIPVWYCDECGQKMAAVTDPTECKHCGSTAIHQDEDVLDTWFSSGLWPFSTLGWPNDTEDLRYFYPTTVMETGYDILFFWVARMIMLGLECTDDIPFETVYLHGLIRDEHGQKMSKSRGNAIDPLEVMNQYGTDALRFTLLTGSTPGNDMKLALSRVEANRNFANKIWNATRFVVNNLGYSFITDWSTWDMGALTLADHWILSRHNRLITNVTQLIDAYQFGEAGRQIYDFLWGEFCDWYIEMSKIRLYGRDARRRLMVQKVLVYVLERTLRLLHPFMPFVTEALWQELSHEGESLMMAPWPEPKESDDEAEEEMGLVMEAIRAVRNARAEYGVEPGQRIEAIIAAGERYDLLMSQRDILVSLARLDDQKLRLAHTLVRKPARALTLVVGGLEIYLPLAGMVDLAAERERLIKEIEALSDAIIRSEKLLANEDFTRKAPIHVVDREKEKLITNRERKAKLEERLKILGA
ncbi:MAG: valine--tRNA ligase, partial [Anaerolineae bacterium]|nr:valine--tRNA ligase [Anaerolineae bacterium]